MNNKEGRLLDIRGRKIGKGHVNICTSIAVRTDLEILDELRAIQAEGTDVVEWRVDRYERRNDPVAVLQTLQLLRNFLPDTPLIYTYRYSSAKAVREFPLERSFELFEKVASQLLVDLTDIDAFGNDEWARKMIDATHGKGIYVILSMHDFEKTPSVAEMVDQCIRMQYLGADVCKLSVTPNSNADVLHLLKATDVFNERFARIPLITVSMTHKGLISRLVGGEFGSTFTYAYAKTPSASGQLSLVDMKRIKDIIETYGE